MERNDKKELTLIDARGFVIKIVKFAKVKWRLFTFFWQARFVWALFEFKRWLSFNFFNIYIRSFIELII